MSERHLILSLIIIILVTFTSQVYGDAKSRLGIISGRNATFDSPYTRSYVKLFSENAKSISLCGGTLIAHNKILTAAHCVDRAIRITCCMGSLSCARFAHNDTCVTVNANESAYLHKGYLDALQIGHIWSDIAIIKLPHAIVDHRVDILPLCKRKTCYQGLERYYNLNGHAVGCGRTSTTGNLAQVVQEATMATVPIDKGMAAYGDFFLPVQEKYHIIYAQPLPGTEQRICMGDSGGMYVLWNSDTEAYEVCGVVSFSGHNCPVSAPSAYTAVEDYYASVVSLKDMITVKEFREFSSNISTASIEYTRSLTKLIELPIDDPKLEIKVQQQPEIEDYQDEISVQENNSPSIVDNHSPPAAEHNPPHSVPQYDTVNNEYHQKQSYPPHPNSIPYRV